MNSILSIILICVFIVFGAYIFWLLIEYDCVNKQYPKIKFDAFQKFYSINPERWELEDDFVACKIDIERHHPFYSVSFYDYTRERFRFGFLDYQRYKRFHNKVKKDKLHVENMENIAKMLKMVKKDIANMEDLAQQQQKQAMDNLNSILNNLGGTKC